MIACTTFLKYNLQVESWKKSLSPSLSLSLQSEKSRIKEHARDLVSRQNRLRRDQRRINDYCSPSISRKNPSPSSSLVVVLAVASPPSRCNFLLRETHPRPPSPPPGECGRKDKKGKREKVSGGNSIWDEIKPRFRLRERHAETSIRLWETTVGETGSRYGLLKNARTAAEGEYKGEKSRGRDVKRRRRKGSVVCGERKWAW